MPGHMGWAAFSQAIHMKASSVSQYVIDRTPILQGSPTDSCALKRHSEHCQLYVRRACRNAACELVICQVEGGKRGEVPYGRQGTKEVVAAQVEALQGGDRSKANIKPSCSPDNSTACLAAPDNSRYT